VSLKRAEQTDRWASTQAGNGFSPFYSRAGIERALARIAREDAGWTAYFDASAASVTELWYEDLAADPGAVLEFITDTLGLPKPAGWRSLMERQADRLNDEWVDEFERDLLDADSDGSLPAARRRRLRRDVGNAMGHRIPSACGPETVARSAVDE
jgi:LPS sulfotransferase NodH